jgi:uncharacterized membrane protein YgdD (TMEM256/DUF423 family)
MAASFFAGPVRAEPSPGATGDRNGAQAVPAPLAAWVSWVRAEDETAACPVRDGHAICFWPGPLSLTLRAQDGSFSFEVLSDRRQLVRLPGSSGRWPQAVRVDGKPAPVLSKEGVPVLDLPAGSQRIEGRFTWSRLPEQLPVPSEYGQLQLMLEGKPLPHPKRDESGSLWLRDGQTDSGPSQLELTVQRKIQDAVPLQVETRIRIRAAGDAREINLGNVLVAGTVPLSIDAELPVRLDPNGELRLQIRAGSYTLRVLARTAGPLKELASRTRPAPWPAQEAWAFQPDETLRQVKLSGAPAVDPARLELDADLRGLPTFLLTPADKLAFTEVRRGEPEPPPNQLTLERTLWLDQDGEGYTVHDNLSGELHSGFRLELKEGSLGRAAQRGEDQLITQRTAAGALGVEVRDVRVTLDADSRLDKHVSTLPAVGWSEDVRALGITLLLPPGYSLWAVRGVDNVDRSWLGDWDLLGFFFVLVVAFGTAGIAGKLAGLLAFVALGLSYQEPDAPAAVWIVLLAAAALLRVLPRGKFWSLVRAVFAGALVVLAVVGLPFAARSLREAVYPQLAAQAGSSVPFGVGMSAAPEPVPQPVDTAATVEEADVPMRAQMPMSPSPELGKGAGGLSDGRRDEGSSPSRPHSAADSSYSAKLQSKQQDPSAVVQTGPGLPDWQFQSWRLSWSGPVARDHHFELVIVPPLANRALAVLRVLLCALLALLIVRASNVFRRAGPIAPALASALVVLGIASLVLPAGIAHAQFPDQVLLGQLRSRLTKPPECRPDCVRVADLAVQVGPAGLQLRAEVHAQDRTSVRVPGPLALWSPERVRLDGSEARMVALEDGFLHVRLTPGVHVLEVQGSMPASDTLTLRLGDTPAHASVNASGYEVSGVREDGTSEDAIELRRVLTESAAPAAVNLPPWFSVIRRFEFANEFRVHTVVVRETPPGTPTLVHLPLLASESVHDARIQAKDNSALVPFGPDDTLIEFDSTLAQIAQLDLVAGKFDTQSERWELSCGSMWQCDATGLVPVSHEAMGQWQPAFRPWPGERLHIALKKPAPAPGQSTTIDAAKLIVRPGVRATDAELKLSMRTSRGGDHKLWLPAGARLRSFSVNGERRPFQRDGAAYGFSLLPGRAGVVAELELPIGMESLMTVPAVKLDSPAKNVRVIVERPADRWLLWAHGPAWGPAILFWGYLVLVLIVAVFLGRTSGPPLRTIDWLLLGVGLTQISSIEALIVVGFFFLIAKRATTIELSPLKHDLLQFLVALWVVAFASSLFDAVRSGLLVQPDMQVMGAGSHDNSLQWYVDNSGPELPQPTLLSVPMWVYRVLMLGWSLWLARRLLAWAPWTFRAFAAGGLWKKRVKAKPAPPQPATPAPG